jgi:hypothetical protein
LNDILEANLKRRFVEDREAFPTKSPTTEDDSKINSCIKSNPEAAEPKEKITPSRQYEASKQIIELDASSEECVEVKPME